MTKSGYEHKAFKVESSEMSLFNKAIQKVKVSKDETKKYFDLNELKKVMLFTFNYQLNCFKS